ncbi:MAG: carbohydrate ABC transporter permease [Firmicutes bacterium]|nr:carbohydrate ABC transporter permease [Bacillota bacterium]
MNQAIQAQKTQRIRHRKFYHDRSCCLSDYLLKAFVVIVMTFISLITLYPFIYILFYSLSTSGKVGTGLLFYPRGFTFDSYKILFDGTADIGQALLVSVARTTIGPALSLIVNAMGAFALSRKRLIGRKGFLVYVTLTMYFSSGMIPMYILMQKLHLAGTFWVYILPTMFSAFNMILIKTYMEGIPEALEESALIDGANDYVIFFRVTLPLCLPVLAAVVLFDCVNQWNAYSDAMIYNSMKPKLHTLQYVLMTFVDTRASSLQEAQDKGQNQTFNPITAKMALTVIVTVPILCVYPVLQKYFAKGILIGSIKG